MSNEPKDEWVDSSTSGYFDDAGLNDIPEMDNDSEFMGDDPNIIHPYDRTITIQIDNTAVMALTATLFGAFANPTLAPAPPSIIVLESSGNFLQSVTKDNPIQLWGIKYSSPNITQLTQPFKIIRTFETGANSGGFWHPLEYTNPTNAKDNMVDDPTFRLAIDGRTSIQILMMPLTKAEIIFTVKSRRNVINELKGKPLLQVSHTPRPSGNSIADTQIQLLRLRERATGRKAIE